MANKNIKILALILAVLAIVYFAGDFFDTKRKRNFKKYLLKLNKEDVSSFQIFSDNYEKKIKLIFQDNKWLVVNNNIEYIADSEKIDLLLNELKNLKTKNIITRKLENVKDYNLSDCLAAKLVFYNKKNKELAELIIGKTDYKQLTNPGGRPFYDISTYVMLPAKEAIFSIEGTLGNQTRQNYNNWRDKYIFNFEKDKLSSIEIDSPKGDKYSITKQDSVWKIDFEEIEEKELNNYLDRISKLKGSVFVDKFDKNTESIAKVKINCKSKTYISNIYKENDDYIIESGMNTGVFFRSRESGIIKRLFTDKSSFKKNKTKNKEKS